MCRKIHGAAFGSFLHADGRGFRWLSGETEIRHYHSSPGNIRAFCGICGSSMPVLEEEVAHVIVPAGSMDNDPQIRPSVHIHTAYRAPWFEITDTLPQFEEFPPESFWEGSAAAAEPHDR